MPTRLLAARFSGTLGSESNQADPAFQEPESIGIRWNIENLGTQRIEILVKAKNKFDAYDRYNNHLGQRVGVYSHWARQPITGFVTEISYAGANRVLYVAKGPVVRMETELDTNIYGNITIGGSSGGIATVLSNMTTRIDDTSTTNIATNALTLNGWQPEYPAGNYPLRSIQEMVMMSDNSSNIYDFWFVDQPFNGTSLQLWTPHYAARSSAASADWQVNIDDLSDLTLSRNIDDIVTDATVFYGVIAGTHDGANNASVLTDSGESFLTYGVAEGDRIVNRTDASRGVVQSVTATTVTPKSLSGGTDDDFDTGDAYAIEMQDSQLSQNDTTTSDYWDRDVAVFEKSFTSGQATRLAGALIQGNATQVQAFTIGAPTIRDGSGARWPLWEVIAQGGGYIRVNDLFPAAAMLTDSLNNLTTFFITALDYDYSSNSLRVAVDNKDRRLDVRLRRAKIINSEMVNRGQHEAVF